MWKRFENALRQITILARGQPGQVLILFGLIVALAGCYTVLKHPSVVDEEMAIAKSKDSTDAGSHEVTCTDCHNNEYDHRYGSHWGWGWNDWGYYGGFYPFGYSYYNPWRHYYWDPWWSGWGWGGYYDPYPYYPGTPGTPGTPPPKRSPIGRGEMSPQQPPTQAPPPSYNPPAPQNQEQEQQNNNQEQKKRGRSGRG